MDFEEIRRDIEQKQRILHFRDPREPALLLDTLHAEKGLGCRTNVVFGAFFLLFAAGLFAAPFLNDFENGSIVLWVFGMGPLILAGGFFRLAWRRARQKSDPRSRA
ncbi:MAG: hypothetical protein ABSE87_05990 [Terracidiphilus sp.]|jgi:hypothetical protein